MTTDNDEHFLSHESLDAHEWRGVCQLVNALNDFEPLAKRARLGEVVAERLVSLGLVEKGPVVDRYRWTDDTVGYRLTELGWKVKDRGRHPRRKR